MEFDKSKVYTALNADESLIGAKGYFADKLKDLISLVENDSDIGIIKNINDRYGFEIGRYKDWNFFYLVEPAPIQGQLRNDGKEVYYNGQWIKLKEPAPEKWYVFENNFVLNDGKIIYEVVKIAWAYEGEPKFSGSKEECNQWIKEHSKTYRPFKDCDELIETYKSKYQSNETECLLNYSLPTIWVKHKNSSDKYLIIAMTDNVVVLYTNSQTFDMQDLFEQYTFLDGSVCGVEE